MRKAAITLAMLAIAIAAFMPSGEYEIHATTYSGELYVIGSGDTCNEAFTNHSPIPSDFRAIECVYVSII